MSVQQDAGLVLVRGEVDVWAPGGPRVDRAGDEGGLGVGGGQEGQFDVAGGQSRGPPSGEDEKVADGALAGSDRAAFQVGRGRHQQCGGRA